MSTLCEIVFACSVVAWCAPVFAQASPGCENGYRVTARRWDAALRMGWETRQDCLHPEWPSRSVAIGSTGLPPALPSVLITLKESAPILLPILVRAGEHVRLWMRDNTVHIEMSAQAEQSARNGEHIIVRVTRQTDDAGSTVQRIPGIVRGAGDVEMER